MALGVAVVVAPLWSALPSPRQRRLARLRARARALGIQVSLPPLPQVPARFQVDTGLERACYSVRHGLAGFDDRSMMWVKSSECWAAAAAADSVPAMLEDLPEGVDVVELKGPVLRIFWSEIGEEEAVDVMADAVKQLQLPSDMRYS